MNWRKKPADVPLPKRELMSGADLEHNLLAQLHTVRAQFAEAAARFGTQAA